MSPGPIPSRRKRLAARVTSARSSAQVSVTALSRGPDCSWKVTAGRSGKRAGRLDQLLVERARLPALLPRHLGLDGPLVGERRDPDHPAPPAAILPRRYRRAPLAAQVPPPTARPPRSGNRPRGPISSALGPGSSSRCDSIPPAPRARSARGARRPCSAAAFRSSPATRPCGCRACASRNAAASSVPDSPSAISA